MSTHKQETTKPVSNPQSVSVKKDYGGGAPGPKYTIPCPPKPKRQK